MIGCSGGIVVIAPLIIRRHEFEFH